VNPREKVPFYVVLLLHIEYTCRVLAKKMRLTEQIYQDVDYIFIAVFSGIALIRLKKENVSGNGPEGGSKMVSSDIVYIYFLNRRVPLPNIRRNLVNQSALAVCGVRRGRVNFSSLAVCIASGSVSIPKWALISFKGKSGNLS